MYKPRPPVNRTKSTPKRPIASPGYEHVVDTGKPPPRKPAKALTPKKK